MLNECTDILKDLITIPSYSGQETDIQKYIVNFLTHKGYNPIQLGKSTVLKISGINPKKTLIFNAHIDTVKPLNFSEWTNDPFSAISIDDKLFGLGASDEKATAAVLLSLAMFFVQQPPHCDIYLTFVAEEETTAAGTQMVLAYINGQLSPQTTVAGILGEPTGLSVIGIGHKGNIFLQLTTTGIGGHSSLSRSETESAVWKMFSAAKKMQKLEKLWKKFKKNDIFGNPTVSTFTAITAGNRETPNSYPQTCTATFDIRTTPNFHDKILSEITNTFSDTETQLDYLYNPMPPGFTDPDERIISLLKKLSHAEISLFFASCDMWVFTKYNIPSAIFGPGDPLRIHASDEYCTIPNLLSCFDIYKKLIEEY